MGKVIPENHSEDNQMFLMHDLQINFSAQAYKSAYKRVTAVVNNASLEDPS